MEENIKKKIEDLVQKNEVFLFMKGNDVYYILSSLTVAQYQAVSIHRMDSWWGS